MPLTVITAQAPPAIVATSAAVPARGQTATDGRIQSAILHETRTLHLVLPASYAASARERTYPVVVVFDGEDSTAPAAATSGELSRNGQMPEAIVVTIPNTNRLRDLTPPGLSVSGSGLNEGGDAFLDFIERELLPAIDRQYRGGLPRVLVGHSSGGILATYAAATRPGFRAIVAIDAPTALGDRWLVRKLAARAQSSPGSLRYVSYESRFGWDDESWRALTAAAPASWQLHREHLDGESHQSVPMLAMYLGLREVFRDYSAVSAPAVDPSRVLPYYAGVSRALDADLVPPRGLLLQLVESAVSRGDAATAREAFARLTRGYGAPANAKEIESWIAAAAAAPPTETVESLLSTPFPSIDEATPFLGEWQGAIWMGDAEPRTNAVRLRIRIEDGKVVGETVRRTPEGTDAVQPCQYMRVTPQGLSFGRMNGMEPRGVAIFDGTLRGDTLSGDMHIRGIVGAGDAPPELHFSFTRVR